jgi:hypothetical protein
MSVSRYILVETIRAPIVLLQNQDCQSVKPVPRYMVMIPQQVTSLVLYWIIILLDMSIM